MKSVFRDLVAAGILAVALISSVAHAQGHIAGPIKVSRVPSNIDAGADTMVFLQGRASGTQNYICLPSGGGFAWTFFSHQATLFFDFNIGSNDVSQQIITHFLSPNPDEGGTGRVTWQSSIDTSAIWAKIAPDGVSTDSTFVALGAIPWLKLNVVGRRRGPNGGNILSHATLVQRLNTSGGVAPADGCSQASNVGATALVPYTADYFFYRAIPPR